MLNNLYFILVGSQLTNESIVLLVHLQALGVVKVIPYFRY